MLRLKNGILTKDLYYGYNLRMDLGFISDVVSIDLEDTETGELTTIYKADVEFNLDGRPTYNMKNIVSNLSLTSTEERRFNAMIKAPAQMDNYIKILSNIESLLKIESRWSFIWDKNKDKEVYKEQPVVFPGRFFDVVNSYDEKGNLLTLCSIRYNNKKGEVYHGMYDINKKEMILTVIPIKNKKWHREFEQIIKDINLLETIYYMEKVLSGKCKEETLEGIQDYLIKDETIKDDRNNALYNLYTLKLMNNENMTAVFEYIYRFMEKIY